MESFVYRRSSPNLGPTSHPRCKSELCNLSGETQTFSLLNHGAGDEAHFIRSLIKILLHLVNIADASLQLPSYESIFSIYVRNASRKMFCQAKCHDSKRLGEWHWRYFSSLYIVLITESGALLVKLNQMPTQSQWFKELQIDKA